MKKIIISVIGCAFLLVDFLALLMLSENLNIFSLLALGYIFPVLLTAMIVSTCFPQINVKHTLIAFVISLFVNIAFWIASKQIDTDILIANSQELFDSTVTIAEINIDTSFQSLISSTVISFLVCLFGMFLSGRRKKKETQPELEK